ncbi:hypothetical protein EV127DRAFT_433323 [Xylaria flabelliformis]|nr:hypothetical protein EV127DRAFT_433323 [Xylaria flabelliformis]
MHYIKFIASLAALVSASIAQEFPDPGCSSSRIELRDAAPTPPPSLAPFLSTEAGQNQSQGAPNSDILLTNPDIYVEQVCNLVASLPSSVLGDFQSWGASLLNFASVEISSYDAIVTKCVTTGAAAASITSYIHSIASSPEALCQPTSTSGGGNGTASITPYPTPTGNGTTPSTGISSTPIPTAGAAGRTGDLACAAIMGGLFGGMALL